MADPELSLQSVLMVTAVIGRAKTAAYVCMVAVFSMTAGLIYGAWVDGLGLLSLVLALGLALALLAGALAWLRRRQAAAATAARVVPTAASSKRWRGKPPQTPTSRPSS